MNGSRPNTSAILDRLKDFQRDTVEYVFRRMYTDPDCVRRFLVADEVGLGKTLVARGLIARVVDFLWEKTDRRIDIIYVCSNGDIARQNINRLNVTANKDFAISSRITLLPITVGPLEQSHRRLSFVSFTPGTSFDMGDSAGQSRERELLYWLIRDAWPMPFKKATCVLSAYAGVDGFRNRVSRFPKQSIHEGIRDRFAAALAARADLRVRYEEVCDEIPRADRQPSREADRRRNRLIGELRELLARTCLHWLEPDLIILDEFQRFKHLLQGDGDDAHPAAQLAHHLFNYQEKQSDPTSAARVLLLSATPYKMYTLSQEAESDDHYADFRQTLEFLLPDPMQRQGVWVQIQHFREQLLRIGENGAANLAAARRCLEQHLRRVMVRTERLALSADRNGMLTEVAAESVGLAAADLQQYLALQQVAQALQHGDLLEYWKSAPYLVNFMEEYDFKRKLKAAVEAGEPNPDLLQALRRAEATMLRRDEIERYRRLDPANARLRSLHYDLIERGAWRLLWIAPSLPYYQGRGPYADPKLTGLTKRLVFSSWQVVPKTIAAVLSYEAERAMSQSFRREVVNTPEARAKRRALLRFTFSKGRPTGMPVLGLLYPCRTLAERIDPLAFRADQPEGTLLSLEQALQHVAAAIRETLAPILARYQTDSGPSDESWYWAAPILLDLQTHGAETERWFAQRDLAEVWRGTASATSERDSDGGWQRHVQAARDIAQGNGRFGPPPEDLADTLAQMAIAGPGVVALRALDRIAGVPAGAARADLRTFAGPLAFAFLSLFNQPEVMALLRDRRKETPYWRSVLGYCCDGNLQAVLDEFAHLLVESHGLLDKPRDVVAGEVSKVIQECLAMRTSTVKADVVTAKRHQAQIDPLRLRTRFAMRFGDQESEDGAQASRADHVRTAFNSPFWPFVLSSTSVGQEGLDFHMYCHAVVHWNLPSNPVDLEQREGRVHRYKGHALRKNVAAKYSFAACSSAGDPWAAMFASARAARSDGQNDLFPFWVTPDGKAKIERHVPALPHSREAVQQGNLQRSLVVYRMVFGQNRQEDLVNYLVGHLSEEEIARIADLCRIDLSPPGPTGITELPSGP